MAGIVVLVKKAAHRSHPSRDRKTVDHSDILLVEVLLMDLHRRIAV
jgi:hypothetical protein